MASSDAPAVADPAAVLAEARRWIGTPYHHQAAIRGVGCDCVGLVRGVYEALGCGPVGAVPAYSRDWGDAIGNEGVLAAARAHLIEVPAAGAGPGHVVVLRWRARQLAKHAAILTGATFIHALEPHGVVEAVLDHWVGRRVVAAFVFPAGEGG